jgi:hypothetical protein
MLSEDSIRRSLAEIGAKVTRERMKAHPEGIPTVGGKG